MKCEGDQKCVHQHTHCYVCHPTDTRKKPRRQWALPLVHMVSHSGQLFVTQGSFIKNGFLKAIPGGRSSEMQETASTRTESLFPSSSHGWMWADPYAIWVSLNSFGLEGSQEWPLSVKANCRRGGISDICLFKTKASYYCLIFIFFLSQFKISQIRLDTKLILDVGIYLEEFSSRGGETVLKVSGSFQVYKMHTGRKLVEPACLPLLPDGSIGWSAAPGSAACLPCITNCSLFNCDPKRALAPVSCSCPSYKAGITQATCLPYTHPSPMYLRKHVKSKFHLSSSMDPDAKFIYKNINCLGSLNMPVLFPTGKSWSWACSTVCVTDP